MAGAPVVEAVRDAHLGRRRDHRVRWRSRPCRPHLVAAQARERAGMAQGSLRMSRAIRFAPLVLLLLLLAGLVWRLATPVNTNVSSKLEGKHVPAFALPPMLPTKP